VLDATIPGAGFAAEVFAKLVEIGRWDEPPQIRDEHVITMPEPVRPRDIIIAGRL
jgi:hypothetical protein